MILFSGSKVLRPGRDYDFAVSSGSLRRSLQLNATFTGTSENGAAVEMKILNQVIPTSFLRSFKFKVIKKIIRNNEDL